MEVEKSEKYLLNPWSSQLYANARLAKLHTNSSTEL